jgi:hypothetical protein
MLVFETNQLKCDILSKIHENKISLNIGSVSLLDNFDKYYKVTC